MNTDVIIVVALGAVAAIFVYLRRKKRRKTQRRDSLHQDSGGQWHWVGLDGNPQSGPSRPDRKGGEWDREDASSGGASGFFDGGGDGGGGGGD